MIKFFRHIRQRLLSENKFTRYLVYAIGEIILVVIGILFALQINNWNSQRVDQRAIQNYYERMHEELQGGMSQIDRYTEAIEPLISQNRRTLEILDSGNRDSISALEETLGALGTMWTITLRFPVTEEFLNQDYLSKIYNDSIKQGLNRFKYMKESIEKGSAYTMEQYNNTIEPFFNKHINYSAVCMDRYKPALVMGGPKTDYEALFNSIELWNVVTFKLENLMAEVNTCHSAKRTLEWLDKQIMKEQGNSEGS